MPLLFSRVLLPTLALLAATTPVLAADAPNPLPGTAPLMLEGDIASTLVDGVRDFLIDQNKTASARAAKKWQVRLDSRASFEQSVAQNRQELARMLGLRDPRVPAAPPELVTTTRETALVGRGAGYEIFQIRWRAFGEVQGEGLLFLPTGREAAADFVALPDPDQTPEQFCGLEPGVPAEDQLPRRLAEAGCRVVVVPVLISRERKPRNGRAVLTNREYLYRSAFEWGRHLIGYEVQKVLAAVDWFQMEPATRERVIGVAGYGEGGRIALYAAAVDTRIAAVLASGAMMPETIAAAGKKLVADAPIDRNIFGILEGYDDARLCQLVYPRNLFVLEGRAPLVTIPGEGGGPGQLSLATKEEIDSLSVAIGQLTALSKFDDGMPREFSYSDQAADRAAFVAAFLKRQGIEPAKQEGAAPQALRKLDASARQQRQIDEMDRHSQRLLIDSPYVRAEYWKNLDTTSAESFAKTVEPYREQFKREVIGWFDIPLAEAKPRTKLIESNDKWRRYQVVLDVFPIQQGDVDKKSGMVIAYGLLTIPADLKEGEQRPVLVCQHGLEGRPEDVIGEKSFAAYKAFATKLAERGFITFAPQNLYIFTDRFRYLQRLANPIKKTLFSVIIPQHQQIVKWLGSRPEVDPARIAFYGLSYGGKSAMRIPPLVPEYCLSICSADFNEWVWKNASTHPKNRYTYVWTMEYEIFEFDLGSTFNYAEMAALIAPRPFMVERGHFDGVAPDETVGYEFGKVRHLYQARLKLKDRCEIEWFDGPHTINGQGTYAFLHKHLRWPEPVAAK